LLAVAALLFITAHQLPAPILEIPTPAPSIRPKLKSLSNSREKSVKKAADMTNQEVQVVLSTNTQATLMYLRNYVDTAAKLPFAMKTDVEPSEIIERLRQVLSNRFRNVSITNDSSGGAKKAGLVMVLDLQAHVGMISTQKNTVSLLATFKDGSGRPIQTITAAGSSTVPYPAFRTRFPEAVTAAFGEFSQKLGVGNATITARKQ
jgi:hypothetical protein